jgi:GINS complex subunit 4
MFDADDRFYLNIHKMELERVKYVLKSYLRTRLAKIERHLLYIVEKDCSELLSPAEIGFAFSIYDKRKSHFNEAFFEKIPKKLNVMEQDPLDDRLSK